MHWWLLVLAVAVAVGLNVGHNSRRECAHGHHQLGFFGLIGALITVVAFKEKAIPEFRPLYDVTSERAELLTIQDQVSLVSAAQ
jgi:hypothetical protein